MDKKEIHEGLAELGLTDNQAKIYFALLECRQAIASDLSLKTGINRSVVYRTLEELIRQGLASYVISAGVKYYVAAKPEKILHQVAEKQALARKLVPHLLRLEKPAKE